jgi:hypothetical protein
VRADSAYTKAHYSLGQDYLKLGRRAEALRELDRAGKVRDARRRLDE